MKQRIHAEAHGKSPAAGTGPRRHGRGAGSRSGTGRFLRTPRVRTGPRALLPGHGDHASRTRLRAHPAPALRPRRPRRPS
ncbi:hypothetical protein ACFQV4_02330 [Streptomyces thermocarboxydus]